MSTEQNLPKPSSQDLSSPSPKEIFTRVSLPSIPPDTRSTAGESISSGRTIGITFSCRDPIQAVKLDLKNFAKDVMHKLEKEVGDDPAFWSDVRVRRIQDTLAPVIKQVAESRGVGVRHRPEYTFSLLDKQKRLEQQGKTTRSMEMSKVTKSLVQKSAAVSHAQNAVEGRSDPADTIDDVSATESAGESSSTCAVVSRLNGATESQLKAPGSVDDPMDAGSAPERHAASVVSQSANYHAPIDTHVVRKPERNRESAAVSLPPAAEDVTDSDSERSFVLVSGEGETNELPKGSEDDEEDLYVVVRLPCVGGL